MCKINKEKDKVLSDEQIEELLSQFDSHKSDSDSAEGSAPEPASDNQEPSASDGQQSGSVSQVQGSSTPAFRILVLVFLLILSAWLLPSANVTGLRSTSGSAKDRDSFYHMSSQHLLSDSLAEVHVLPRKYILELSEVLTPAPDESKFDEIYDEERKNFDGAPVLYYSDPSITVKCWREKNDDKIYNFSEIWTSDASQLRRTLVDNVISKKHLDHPQNIFAKTNGVVGMSADYCAYRSYGIIVQYGNVIRESDGNVLDIAVYDKEGNFYAYNDNMSFFETDAFKNGDVIHTFAFGPVLVDNYEVSKSPKLTNRYYPGELNDLYPRAAICQFDYDTHYLLCTLDYRGTTAKDFAGMLQSKGVRFAYNLDGGQTATLMFHQKIFNKVAYGGTRPVSDILYFATAIPNN